MPQAIASIEPPPRSIRDLIGCEEILKELRGYARSLLIAFGTLRSTAAVEEEAGDVVQAVCVRVLDKESTYRPERGGLGWLRKVAFHIVWNRTRDLRRHRLRFSNALFEEVTRERPAPVVEDRRWVWDYVDRLRPRHREVIWLRCFCGLDNAEVAARLRLAGPKRAADLLYSAKIELRTAIGAASS